MSTLVLPKRTVELQPRLSRTPNIARALVSAQRQLSEQNDGLRDALDDAPDYAQVLATACSRTLHAAATSATSATSARARSHPLQRA